MNHMKKYYVFVVLIILVIMISIGYAYLSTSLTISGSSNINNPTWDIHFENVVVSNGSVLAEEPEIDSLGTTVTYVITLENPGDFYEFSVDAVNDGSIDAMIDTVVSKLNNVEITTLPSYLIYTVTYSDGVPILSKQELNAGEHETYKIRVEFKKDITSTDLPNTEQNLTFSFSASFVQKDDSSIPMIHPVDFATDSWETIVSAVQSGNTDVYGVGDTKEMDLGSFGTHTLRIANKSTPEECNNSGFSQTACGFVLEFSDIITTHRINPYTDASNNGDGNTGGWEYSEIRSFLNTDVYRSLPEILQNNIISTYVVSGHGSGDTSNFNTTDKIYLLSTHEVWIDDDGIARAGIGRYDTAYSVTRQLDYYLDMGTSNTSTTRGVKKYNGVNYVWWLRTASGSNQLNFYSVKDSGSWYASSVSSTVAGVSPAFRIG